MGLEVVNLTLALALALAPAPALILSLTRCAEDPLARARLLQG